MGKMRKLQEEGERDPSFGLARFNKVSAGGGGASLFDSEIRHRSYIILQIDTASRRRELARDWLHPEQQIIEVAMSHAQFGALVSSFGDGGGVPVTISHLQGEIIPEPAYEPRMKESLREIEGATDKLMGDVAEAVEALVEAFDERVGRREMAELLHDLEAKVRNAKPNTKYLAKTFAEHVEKTITKAKADIEAAAQFAAQRGLDAGTEATRALGTGE